MPKDYQKTKIYYIDVNGERYYGHTTEALSRRKAKHKYEYKKYPERKVYKAMRDAGIGADDIELKFVENYPCNDVDEAEARERWWIENYASLNVIIPTRTKREWYEANKEQLAEYRRVWRKNNKQELVVKKHEYYEANKNEISQKHREYYEAHKEQIAQYHREYYEAHKEQMSQQGKERVNCPCCNKEMNKKSLCQHIRTQHPEYNQNS